MENLFCVYLTIYSGNKLPPYYIGSSTIDRISKGYRGSVKSKRYSAIWATELRSNPNLFKIIIIARFKTRQEALQKENQLQMKLNVIKNPLYINQSFAQPVGAFGNRYGYSNSHTLDSIKKIRKSLKRFYQSERGLELSSKRSLRMSGSNNPQYGKTGTLCTAYGRTKEKHPLYGLPKEQNPNFGRIFTEEHRRKISENHHDCSGSKNSRALNWKLTSPSGETYDCCGDVERITSDLRLGLHLLRKYIGEAVPPRSNRATNPISKNTVGWKLEKIKPS